MALTSDEVLRRIVENLQCCVCMDADKDTVLMPCKHLCACAECAQGLRQCPLCRAPVTNKMRIFGVGGVKEQAASAIPSPRSSPRSASGCSGAPLPPPFPVPPGPPGGMLCPLHGPQCPAGPFTDRAHLEAHVNDSLDSAPVLGEAFAPPPFAQPVHWPQQPPLIEVICTTSEPELGMWGMNHQVYHFNLVIAGQVFPIHARYSTLRQLNNQLGHLSPQHEFPARDILAWLTGHAGDERTLRRHRELRCWLEALFAPRVIEVRQGRLAGYHDAAGALLAPQMHKALGLEPAAVAALQNVADMRRVWYSAAIGVLAEYGTGPGRQVRSSVIPQPQQ